MPELERYFIVWDMTEGTPVDNFPFLEGATTCAKATANARLGNTIAIFEPKDAFRAEAQVEKVYLDYPTRTAREEPPPPPSPPIEEAPPTPPADVEF